MTGNMTSVACSIVAGFMAGLSIDSRAGDAKKYFRRARFIYYTYIRIGTLIALTSCCMRGEEKPNGRATLSLSLQQH
jgi:hypothetical protein